MVGLHLPEPFIARDGHIAIRLPGAWAMFTTRHGGCSEGPYASLNLGSSSGDDPERERRLGVRLLLGHQVHGTRVARRPADGQGNADRQSGGQRTGGREHGAEADLPADGQATACRGLAPAVLTADCLAVAIAGEGAVAVVHAGWRGLAGGVIGEGVRALRELGARGALGAAIGPGAGGCCYEVGEDVLAAFARHPQARRGPRRLHLAAIAAAQLRDAGVQEIHDVGLCTICAEGAPFYSHRRDRGVTGRQAGLAWLC
jgi:YfiH family protein